MGDERRWAARYQFLDELWRGRDRIVCDRELEAALHAGVEGPLGELIDNLIPGEGGGGRAWVALHNERRAASFARERGGTVFVGLDDAAEIAGDERWEVALVHLAGSASAAPRTRAELLASGSGSGGLEAFLELLGERVEDDGRRSVVLSLPCGPDEDHSYELLAALVEELFGDGRIYGLTRPGMAAFYEFGPVLEGEGEGEGEQRAEAEIEVDNSLGSEAPRFELFLAVVGARVPGEGVTFIELPAASTEPGAPVAGDDELGALRVQLAEAQRRGDMQAIERQALLEKLEQAEDRIAVLEEELESAPTGDGGGASEAAADRAAPDSGPRVDELLAREQTLRWELERLRGELEHLEARPVEALEAEAAALRAQLEAARSRIAELEQTAEEADAEGSGARAEELAELALLLDDLDEPTPAQAREWRRARSKLEHLLHKLERGGRLSALELHRELAQLRRLV